MAISSLGVGSGLDLNQIVGDLVNAERAPREERLDRREQKVESQISAFGELTSSVDQLGSSLSSLAGFEPQQVVSVGDESVARVTTDGTAENRSFSLEVEQLAQAEIRATASGAFADGDEEVGAGQLTIQVGGNDVTLDIEEGMTLRDVRDAINESGAGVAASIVNDENGARLVFESDETGAANSIGISVTGGTPEGLGRLENTEVAREAQDARAFINGLEINSASNTLDNAIDGVEIELTGTSGGAPTTVSIDEDRDELQQLLEGFVENYNALVGQTSQLTRFDPESEEGSVLTGDSTVRNIRSRLGNALMGNAQVPEATASTFAELGIVSNRDGTLSFDSSRFNEALDRDGFDTVADVVRDISGQAEGIANSFTGRDGLIAARTDGLQGELRRIGSQREDLDMRMEQLEQRLVRQFSRMDQMVAQMQSTGDYLTNQLANMPLANNNSR
ncbi:MULTISPECIES: flagellar filament capping protein FliD [unclassified Thioalkalivibrio]|uniref:flagellar filament capping protein FliD n=1 Tax=unclassified Thioalkalivibrio TaxID=2621013 RepID=UPI0003768CAF|nr:MULTISPECIES: flagellar filament capping protein FliD [unclassified Thioalkalivibrio]